MPMVIPVMFSLSTVYIHVLFYNTFLLEMLVADVDHFVLRLIATNILSNQPCLTVHVKNDYDPKDLVSECFKLPWVRKVHCFT